MHGGKRDNAGAPKVLKGECKDVSLRVPVADHRKWLDKVTDYGYSSLSALIRDAVNKF